MSATIDDPDGRNSTVSAAGHRCAHEHVAYPTGSTGFTVRGCRQSVVGSVLDIEVTERVGVTRTIGMLIAA